MKVKILPNITTKCKWADFEKSSFCVPLLFFAAMFVCLIKNTRCHASSRWPPVKLCSATLRSWTRDYREQIQLAVRGGLELRASELQVQRLMNCSATPPLQIGANVSQIWSNSYSTKFISSNLFEPPHNGHIKDRRKWPFWRGDRYEKVGGNMTFFFFILRTITCVLCWVYA